MSSFIKRIGVLTSGGDAPGMNAAVRGVVHAALHRGIEVMGIYGGFSGLMTPKARLLSYGDVSDILSRGGSFLRTARCRELHSEEGLARAAANAKELMLDALVVIGGDGSFRGAGELAKFGVRVVGIPATIDNDIGCTDYTIGFDTALNTALWAIDRIRDTAYSHERCSIVEVMGHHSGYIAYHTALAGGAEAVLLPEQAPDFEKQVIAPLLAWRERGKRDFIVVVAEGVANLDTLPSTIEKALGVRPTYSMLGYIQRGGAPTLRDRSIALRMGERAVAELLAGCAPSVIAMRGEELFSLPMDEALLMQASLTESEIAAAMALIHG